MYTEVLKINLFAFAYRLFHEDFSPPVNRCIYLLYYSSDSRLFLPQYVYRIYDGNVDVNVCEKWYYVYIVSSEANGSNWLLF